MKTAAQIRVMAGLVERLLIHHGGAEQDLAYVTLDHMLKDKGEFDRLFTDHKEIDERLRLARMAKTATDARRLLKHADVAVCLSLEAMRGERAAFDRGHLRPASHRVSRDRPARVRRFVR
jgi:hypothetical protein